MSRKTCALCPSPAWKLRAKYCLTCDRARRQRLCAIRAEKLRAERAAARCEDFTRAQIHRRYIAALYETNPRRALIEAQRLKGAA